MAVTAFVLSILAVLIAAAAAIFAGIQAVETKRARRIMDQTEHRQAQPDLDVRLGQSLGGGGYELKVTSSRQLDAVTVAYVADSESDHVVTGITSVPAPPLAGKLVHAATVSKLPAGSTTVLGLWTQGDREQIGGTKIRLNCTVKIGDRTWPDLIRVVTLPRSAKVLFA